MRFKRKTGGILIVISLVVILSVKGSSGFRITKDENDQQSPAIYGDYVVWEDNRDGNWDIYGYNLLTQEEFQITTDPSDQKNPAIYMNIVVWQDHRNGNWDIYGYNLCGGEFQITTDLNDQENPAIYRHTVVWEDSRNGNWDIYGYNLGAEEEFQITTDPSDQENPAIYSRLVVWEDSRNGNWDIYGYNLDAEEEFQITTDPSDQWNPAVHDFLIILENMEPLVNFVVWVDDRNGNQDIYGYRFSTAEMFQITTDPSDQKNPAIHSGIVVWGDYTNSNWDIYGYNLTSKQVFPIATYPGHQRYPAFYECTAIWTDNRNDNHDIYGNIIPSEYCRGCPVTNWGIEEYLELVFWILRIFETVAILILSVYFSRDFVLRRFRASLAWSVGFILYSSFVSYLLYFTIPKTLSSTIKIRDPIIMMIGALGMTLLYYGTSLLLFSKGSFFREKMSVLIIMIYSVFVFCFMTTSLYSNIGHHPGSEIIDVVLPVLKTPILLVITILFFRIYRKIDPDDPSKRISLMVTTAWFLLIVNAVSMALWWRCVDFFDIPSLKFPIVLVMSGLQPVAWILMVYSMVIRKAAALTRKRRIEQKV